MPTTEQETEPFPDDLILKVQGQSSKPITVTLELNGKHGSQHGSSCFLDVRNNPEEVVPSSKASENDHEAPDLYC